MNPIYKLRTESISEPYREIKIFPAEMIYGFRKIVQTNGREECTFGTQG